MFLPKHLPALDALRGIAITLVIASHALPMAQNLPWAIKRFSNLGFFGVQLFFVVSSVTLANSWCRAPPTWRAFALRRMFRIAPAFLFAAALYALLRPAHTHTAAGAWIGVPGGWSIEAEFAFYALFPVLMAALSSFPRSLAACLASLPLAWLANRAGHAWYAPQYGEAATDQLLYYWPPNQLPVFLLGLAAYEMTTRLSPAGPWRHHGRMIAARCPTVCCLSLVTFLLLAFLPWPRLPQPDHLFLPVHILASLAFAAAAIALLLRPWPVIANRLAIAIGQASFSAYLIHFAMIAGLEYLLPPALLQQTGLPAAITACALFLSVFALTAVSAQLTYRLIEQPGIRLGFDLITRITPAGPS
jgi:peptidoglycan/LPS O-acetylase OafA/YrhL